jgi:hypothetical protein
MRSNEKIRQNSSGFAAFRYPSSPGVLRKAKASLLPDIFPQLELDINARLHKEFIDEITIHRWPGEKFRVYGPTDHKPAVFAGRQQQVLRRA